MSPGIGHTDDTNRHVTVQLQILPAYVNTGRSYSTSYNTWSPTVEYSQYGGGELQDDGSSTNCMIPGTSTWYSCTV
jgi:hypothetical protein